MKIIKTKIATALVLGAISFGMFSFTTTPINAQVTTSQVSVNETDSEAALWTLLGRAALRGLAAGLGYILGERLIGSEQQAEYPGNALD